MRKISENQVLKRNSILWAWENQHPVMHWWFVLSTISFSSVFVYLFSQF